MRKGFVGAFALLLASGVGSAQAQIFLKKATLLPPAASSSANKLPNDDTAPTSSESTLVQTQAPGVVVPGMREVSGAPNVYRVWANVEYLMWWTKASPLPTPVLSTGQLDDPKSTVLLGGSDPFKADMRQGGRFSFGFFLDDTQRFGVEAGYFFLGNQSQSRTVSSDGSPTSQFIGFPYKSIGIGGAQKENFFFLSNPGFFADQTTLTMSLFLQGYEVNGTMSLLARGRSSVTMLAGFRYLDLQEQLNMFTYSPPISTNPTGSTFNVVDEFGTRNQFYGGQLGLRGQAEMGRFFVSATGKVALGSMHQTIVNGGGFDLSIPGLPLASTPGGFYTQPTNIGQFQRDRLAWIPEATVNVGARLGNHVKVFAGYNILWISDIVRPGDQIDGVINDTQVQGGKLAGPARPAVPFNESSFWAQGLNFGMTLSW